MTTETVQHSHSQYESRQPDSDPNRKMSLNEKDRNLIISAVTGAQHPRDPDEIAEPPSEKQLAFSMKDLGVDDFDLLKTLGTGMHAYNHLPVPLWTTYSLIR
jgi:hypothetical protein